MKQREDRIGMSAAIEGLRMAGNPLSYVEQKVSEMVDVALVSKGEKEKEKLGKAFRYELSFFLFEKLKDIQKGWDNPLEDEASLPRKAEVLTRQLGGRVEPIQLHYGIRVLYHIVRRRPELIATLEGNLLRDIQKYAK